MKKIPLFTLFCLVSTFIYAQKKPFTIYDYFRLKNVAEVSISPDGKFIAYTLNINKPISEGKGNDYRELYLKDLSVGDTKGLITGPVYLSQLDWTPDSKTITFLARFDNLTNNQLYGFDIGGAEYRLLSNIPGGIRNYEWHPGGQGFLFTAQSQVKPADESLKKTGFDAEIFEENLPAINLYYLNNQTITKLNQSGTVFDFAWSPDGKKIAAQVAPQNLVDHSYMFKRIYLIDPVSGEQNLWINNPGKLNQMAWSPDSKNLAFIAGTDIHDPVGRSLFVTSVTEKSDWATIQNLTLDFEGHVKSVTWKDPKTLYFCSDESVAVTLREINIHGKKSRLIRPGGDLVFSDFSLTGDWIVMLANTSAHPDELYTFDLSTHTTRQLTNHNSWLEEIGFGRQEKISYHSRDGLRIEGVIIFPYPYDPQTRYPLICYIHGGPESCVLNGWVTSYSNWGQIATGEGYFVFLPNYRASSGRGVEFSKADQGDLGDEEFLDVLDGIDTLSRAGLIDKTKVGIGGGSYGGYFAALASTRYSDHFAASVVFVGISNQLSKFFLSDIPYEEYYVHWKMWPNENPELFYDRSPVKYCSNNKTPTLILHGKEDTRVHPSQSLELYRGLKLAGQAPVRLIFYPGEGHGNRNNPSQLDYNLRTMQWFNYYLKEGGNNKILPPDDISYDLEKLNE